MGWVVDVHLVRSDAHHYQNLGRFQLQVDNTLTILHANYLVTQVQCEHMIDNYTTIVHTSTTKRLDRSTFISASAFPYRHISSALRIIEFDALSTVTFLHENWFVGRINQRINHHKKISSSNLTWPFLCVWRKFSSTCRWNLPRCSHKLSESSSAATFMQLWTPTSSHLRGHWHSIVANLLLICHKFD